ncbi:alpha/beta fold hydrolase [Celeribacter sp.]|uniref:alpha/beta fold hydrolase n=1 Tax=Celeribacter sp. TaxID=1890673 RepID=UPI003A909BFE
MTAQTNASRTEPPFPTAPYHADVAQGPETWESYWLTADDGIRIRAGIWRDPAMIGETPKGTIFILPGRTEAVEKYARGAAVLGELGYASLAIDWRGQGLADRLLDDPTIGHVERFSDYQRDLAAVIDMAKRLDLPKPWGMIAHSMGGAIGLRALMGDHPFEAATFSAPMWGIGLSPTQKLLTRVVAPVLKAAGFANRHAPGTNGKPYYQVQPFEGNTLTSDAEMYAYMRRQVEAEPRLGLGGPSSHWVLVATAENAAAARLPSPDIPALCFLGTDEAIVDSEAVRDRMSRWPNGTLISVPKGRHEIPMELPPIRAEFYARAAALLDEVRMPMT